MGIWKNARLVLVGHVLVGAYVVFVVTSYRLIPSTPPALLLVAEPTPVLHNDPLAPVPATEPSSDSNRWPLRPDEIALLVMSGTSTAATRIPTLHKLFSSFQVQLPVFLVIDKKPEMVDLGNWTVMEATECGDSQTSGLCCKTSYGLKSMMDRISTNKWFLRTCDDTYIHFSNVIPYLEHFDPDKPWYLGEKYMGSHVSSPYADGGAGWILSRGAIAKIVPHLNKFFDGRGDCYDDVRFGHFMHTDMGIPLHQASGFHNEQVTIVPCMDPSCKHPRLVLEVPHTFHASHGGKDAMTRPITFHTRMGKQAGAAGRDDVDLKWFMDLKNAVDEASKHLPVLDDEDREAISRSLQ